MKQKELLARFTSGPIDLEGGMLVVQPRADSRVVAQIRLGGEVLHLDAKLLGLPYPSALKKLKQEEPNTDTVLVERIPPGLQEAARALNMNYLDLQGRGRVLEPNFVYVVPPNSGFGSVRKKTQSSPFAQKSSRVVRALLSNPTKRWRLSDIATEVDLNPGNVHRGLNTLVEDGYVERDGDLYVLIDPGSLLETWAELARSPGQKLTIPIGDSTLPNEMNDLMARLGPVAAVSGEFGAELAAPHLPAKSAQVHCADPDLWASLEERDDGSLASRLLVTTSPGTIEIYLSDAGVLQFGSIISGFPVVSPAQLFVDLYRQKNRSRQAAEVVRSQLLGF